MKLHNTNVLITGGASGIGKLMAQLCLRKKARTVILWDINEAALNATIDEFAEQGYKNVCGYVLDVADVDSLQATAEAVQQDCGVIDVLINNAGVVVGKNFEAHTHQDIDFTLDVNVRGVMHTTLAFITGMIAQRKGHIVNIASAAGMMSNPKMSVYVGSKWAVLGWSESIRLELERQKSGVHITTVTTGYIDTGMFDGIKMNLVIPVLQPAEVAEAVINAIETNKTFVRMPKILYSLPFLKGIMPVRMFDKVVGEYLDIYESMSSFTGRKK
jgi:short-subunit dehydrogenase